MTSNIKQAFLYFDRVTIGKSVDLACTAVEATHTIPRPGGYIITNLGPDPVNVRMFPASGGTFAVTTSDAILHPVGSGDRSEYQVLVAPNNSEYNPPKNVVHAICGAGKTATIRITRITED